MLITQVKRSLLRDLTGRERKCFLYKAIFPVKKLFFPFSHVLSSVAELREQSKTVDKVLLFWKLYHLFSDN